MRHLKDVTLITADDFNGYATASAMYRCLSMMRFGDVKLISNNIDTPYTVRPRNPILGRNEYANFIMNEMSDHVDTEFMMYFQHDGFIWHPDSWDDAFLKYDYIGAPWWMGGENCVGSAGFHLVSKRLMEFMSSLKIPYEKAHPSDVVMCIEYADEIRAAGFKFAPEELASRFCLEWNDKYNRVSSRPFGIHGVNTLKEYGIPIYG